jgi:hypothetical protein
MPEMSIDDVVIGVRAIDKDGNPSLVSAYVMAPTRLVEPAPPASPATAGSGPGGGQYAMGTVLRPRLKRE